MGWRHVFGRRRWHGFYQNYRFSSDDILSFLLVLMRFSIVQFFSFAYDNIHFRRPPLKERSVLYQRTGGHRPPRPIKTRAATKYFNNEWQKGRYLQVENLGFVEACEQRGIQVLKPEAIFTSHLPGVLAALFLCTLINPGLFFT